MLIFVSWNKIFMTNYFTLALFFNADFEEKKCHICSEIYTLHNFRVKRERERERKKARKNNQNFHSPLIE